MTRRQSRQPPREAAVTAKQYADAALAANTKLAYQKDLDRFLGWRDGVEIPCSSELVAEYIAEHAKTHKASTLSRWVSSISTAHQRAGVENPCTTSSVRAVLRGIKRQHGAKRRRVLPAMTDELKAMVDKCPANELRGRRDAAVLLVGFAGALRRSEVAALTVEAIQFDPRGCVLSLGKTKTDQTGENDEIAIPKSKSAYCPVAALKAWIKASGITGGPVFRKIHRSGSIGRNALNDRAIAEIVKGCAEKAGLTKADYSGHSLRAGLATSSARAGKPYHKIKQQTRHKSDAMLLTYVRDAERFDDNAAEIL